MIKIKREYLKSYRKRMISETNQNEIITEYSCKRTFYGKLRIKVKVSA